MIELSIGPYRSGKTGRLLRELVDYKLRHPLDECLILVPSHRYGRLVKRQLEEILKQQSSKSAGIFGVQIANLSQTCQQIMKASGANARVLPADLCVKLVSAALAELHQEKQLVHLDSIHSLAGTAGSLYRLFEEFERAALPPSEVLRAVQSTAAESSRQLELAKVYQRYWQKLDALNCLDEKRVALTCRELLAKRNLPGWRLRYLVVDGFDRISPLQAEVIEGISLHTAETRIAFDYLLPEDRPTNVVVQNDSATAGATPCVAPENDIYAWKDSSFNELRKRFAVQPVLVDETGVTTCPRQFAFNTLDSFAEVQEVARRCKEAIAVRGIAPKQILVTARDVSAYATAIQLAFTQAGLPFFIDQAFDLAAVPWMKYVRSLLSVSVDDFPRRAVVDLLRSRYIDLDRLGVRKIDVDRIDKKTLSAKVISSREQWSAAVAEEGESASAVLHLIEMLTPPAVASVHQHCKWVEDVLEQTSVRFSSRPTAKGADGEKLLAPSSQESQAVKSFRNILRNLLLEEQFFGEQQLTFAQFLTRIIHSIEGGNFRFSEPPDECIYICSAEHAPNRRYDEVFVIGALEGNFPKHSGDSGFTSGEERLRWQTFGVTINNPREEVGYEKALFTSLIQRARRSLWISYPQVDLSGDEIFPSFYLTDGTCQTAGIEHIDIAREAMMQPASAREAIFGWLWKHPAFVLPDSLTTREDIEEYWQQTSPIVYGAFQRHQKETTGAYNGDLSSLVEGGWLECKLPVAWSASALNNYGQCPFKYWVSGILGIQPTQEAQPGLDVMERGKLFHRILELYYKEMIAKDIPITESINEAAFTWSLDTSFGEVERDPKFHPTAYWNNEKTEISFRVRRFLQYDLERLVKSGAKPYKLEAKFGTHDATDAGLKVMTERGEAVVRGIIDRIDVTYAADGSVESAVVIDYKSGSSPISLDEARCGANIQIPLYALAVEQSVMPGVPVKAGHYLSVMSAKSTGSMYFEKDSMRELLPIAQQKVSDAVAGVSDGKFSISPYAKRACNTCDHTSICRISDLKQISERAD